MKLHEPELIEVGRQFGVLEVALWPWWVNVAIGRGALTIRLYRPWRTFHEWLRVVVTVHR